MGKNHKIAIIISPNWRDYGKKYLSDCLDSVKKQNWTGESKIFLIDNETSDESFAFLKASAPEAQIIREQNNEGFCKSNNDAMRQALAQGYGYILLFNIDTELEPDAVKEMIRAAESDDRIAAVQARLMLHPETDRVNSLGNATHFLGFGYTVGYKQKLSDIRSRMPDVSDIFYPSGAAVLFKADALREVGLYDENYWMYNEDQEHGWRLRLAGWRCVLAYDAVVYHKYEFSRSLKKFYWMDRNRILSIMKCYAWPTLVLIIPAFLVMEIGLLGFSLRGGWFMEKLRVYSYFFLPGTWSKLIRSRRAAQKSRKVSDRRLSKIITGKILFQEFDSLAMRLANIFLGAYWSVIRMIIFW
jgi:GT2 family glycosyltransferase